MVLAVVITSSVYPSGALRAIISVAVLLPAPGLFSTMTGWPSRSDTYWPISRPRMSAGPPGGKPETMWIGGDGQVSARASRDASGSAAAPAVRCRKRRRANMAFSSRVGAHLRAGYLAAGWREKVGRRRSGYVDAVGSAP